MSKNRRDYNKYWKVPGEKDYKRMIRNIVRERGPFYTTKFKRFRILGYVRETKHEYQRAIAKRSPHDAYQRIFHNDREE